MAYLDDLLATDESIRLVAHRHILFLILHTALYIFGALAVWILALIAYRRLPDTANLIVMGLLLAFSIVPTVIAVYRFLRWKMEQYVVTSYRIIQVEGIINKRTFDSALDKVNDVLMTQGALGRLFGFGNIKIITGSEIGVNDLTGIAEPQAFKRALLESKMRKDEARSPIQPVEPVAVAAPVAADSPERAVGDRPGQDNARLLAALVDLRDSGVISADEYEHRKRQLLG